MEPNAVALRAPPPVPPQLGLVPPGCPPSGGHLRPKRPAGHVRSRQALWRHLEMFQRTSTVRATVHLPITGSNFSTEALHKAKVLIHQRAITFIKTLTSASQCCPLLIQWLTLWIYLQFLALRVPASPKQCCRDFSNLLMKKDGSILVVEPCWTWQ